jgi:ATP-dependent protease ClpP protease subunit
MLKHDSWFDAEECLARGLVDEILWCLYIVSVI